MQRGQKVPLAFRGFSAANLITVASYIEHGSFAMDVVFLEIRNGEKGTNGFYHYSEDKNSRIKISMDSIELRALSNAMKDVDSGDGLLYYLIKKSDGVMKTLRLGKTQSQKGDTYFVNINSFSVAFDKWSFYSFADSLRIIADEAESFLYKYQRGIKR